MNTGEEPQQSDASEGKNEHELVNPREVNRADLKKWVRAYVAKTDGDPELPTAVGFKIDDVIKYLTEYREKGARFLRVYHAIGTNWNGKTESFSFLLPLRDPDKDNPIVDSLAISSNDADTILILNECCHCPPCDEDEMQKRD